MFYGIGVALSASMLYVVVPLHNASLYTITIDTFGISNRYVPDSAHAQNCSIEHVGPDSFSVKYSNTSESPAFTSYQAQYITMGISVS